MYSAGSLTTGRQVLETEQEQHLRQEGSRPPLPPRLSLLCSQEGAEVLLAALVGIAGPRQYPKGFSDTVVKRR